MMQQSRHDKERSKQYQLVSLLVYKLVDFLSNQLNSFHKKRVLIFFFKKGLSLYSWNTSDTA